MRAAELMSSMMLEIVRTNPVPMPQEGEPTVFRRRRPEDGGIEPLDAIEKVYDFIRMLDADGYPPAFLETHHLRLEFSRAQLRPGEVRADVTIKAKKNE